MSILPGANQMRHEKTLRKDHRIEVLQNVIQSKDEYIAELLEALAWITTDYEYAGEHGSKFCVSANWRARVEKANTLLAKHRAQSDN